jgi:hypothetical protein
MKLDSEDYENIYLRIRGKLWLFWAAVFGALGGTGLVVGYFSISSAIEVAVNKYLQTEQFAQSIAKDTESRLARLEERERELARLLAIAEKRAGTVASLPIAITDGGVTLVGSDGAKFHVETGSTKRGEPVLFKSAFSRPPMVLLAPNTDRFGRPAGEPLTTSKDVSVIRVAASSTGFKNPYVLNSSSGFSWLAIGQ